MDETPATPDTSPTPPSADAPASAPPTRSKPRGRSVFLAIGLITLVAAVALSLILNRAATTTASKGATATTATPTDTPLVTLTAGDTPPGWATFHDSQGYFTIAVPPGWTIDGGQDGYVMLGDSYTTPTYAWFVHNPADGPSGPGVAEVIISYYALSTAFARQHECQRTVPANITFDGLPAATVGANNMVLVTGAATYQINYGFLPDTRYFTNPPTPIPAATLTAGTDLSIQILSTFRPIPATPPSC